MFTYWFNFSGKQFRPPVVFEQAGVCVNEAHAAGEIATKRDPRESYNFGYLRLESRNLDVLLSYVLQIYLEHRLELDDMELEVLYFYENQCNIELTADQIKILASMNASVSISCEEK